MSRLQILLGVILLTAGPATAADQASCRVLATFATVTDQQGSALPILDPAGFRVTIGGREVRLLRVELRQRALNRIVILVDVSHSMAEGRGQWVMVRELLTEALTAIPEQTPLATIVFGSEVYEVFPFETPRHEIASAVAGLDSQERKLRRVGGATALRDSIIAALGLLAPAQMGDAIYVITDGADNRSKASVSRVEELLVTAGVPLFSTLLLGRARRREEQTGPADVERLVKHSGGFFVTVAARFREGLEAGALNESFDFSSQDVSRIRSLVQYLYHRMQTFHAFEFEAGGLGVGRRRLRIDAVNEEGRRRRDVIVHHPRSVAGCAPRS